MTDRITIRLVVLMLGLLATGGLAGVVYLVAVHTPAESLAVVVALAGPPAGALSSMLVSTRSAPPEPAEPADRG